MYMPASPYLTVHAARRIKDQCCFVLNSYNEVPENQAPLISFVQMFLLYILGTRVCVHKALG